MKGQKIDRLSIRGRPPGAPLMHQTWENLLFMSWPIPAELLRPFIPARLEIETHHRQAWISVTPFKLSDLHPIGLPAIPGLSWFYELNLRTYVHLDGVPGLWFFSLDASKTIPVLAARFFWGLPYEKAEMEMRVAGASIFYSSRRCQEPPAEFEALWHVGETFPVPSEDSLIFFVCERYCLYAAVAEKLFRTRVYHVPWLLRQAQVETYRSTLFSSKGLPEPAVPPLVQYGEKMEVEVWPAEEV